MEETQFLLKMFLEKPAVRFVAVTSLILFGFASSAMADLTPFDPHALLATGGDATPITNAGLPITFSATGGGIFVFQNDTGSPLSKMDVDVQFPTGLFPNGFGVDGTIFVPAGSGQQASFQAFLFQNETCAGVSDTSASCVEMVFALKPGPLVPTGGNFVLDFDNPDANGDYQGVDASVAGGTYTGGTDTSSGRVGDWPDGAQGFVTPIIATPEPRQYAGWLTGFLVLAIYSRRRRNTVAQ
jgi:hypothetical protein